MLKKSSTVDFFSEDHSLVTQYGAGNLDLIKNLQRKLRAQTKDCCGKDQYSAMKKFIDKDFNKRVNQFKKTNKAKLASLTEAQIIMSDENNSSDNETQEEQQMETSILDSISS